MCAWQEYFKKLPLRLWRQCNRAVNREFPSLDFERLHLLPLASRDYRLNRIVNTQVFGFKQRLWEWERRLFGHWQQRVSIKSCSNWWWLTGIRAKEALTLKSERILPRILMDTLVDRSVKNPKRWNFQCNNSLVSPLHVPDTFLLFFF